MADEKKLLSRKTKDFSDINAFESYVNAFDNNYKKNKPKKENGSCFTCGSFSHWQRDCPMKAKQTDRRPVNRINLKKTPAEWQNQKRSIRARQRVNAIPMEETDGQTDDESDSDDSQASHMTGFAPSDDEEEDINNVEGDDTEAESESDSEEFEHMVNALTEMFRKKKSAKVNKVEGRKRTPKHWSNWIYTDSDAPSPVVQIEGIGPVLADSGSSISLIRPSDVPPSAIRIKMNCTVEGICGSVIKLKYRYDVRIAKTGDNYHVADHGTKISFYLCRSTECTILSYYDIAKLGIIVNNDVDEVDDVDDNDGNDDSDLGGKVDEEKIKLNRDHVTLTESMRRLTESEFDLDRPIKRPASISEELLSGSHIATLLGASQQVSDWAEFVADGCLKILFWRSDDDDNVADGCLAALFDGRLTDNSHCLTDDLSKKANKICMVKKRDVVNLVSGMLPFAKLRVFDRKNAPARAGVVLQTRSQFCAPAPFCIRLFIHWQCHKTVTSSFCWLWDGHKEKCQFFSIWWGLKL